LIVTPEHLIKKYFPEPVETTRFLYDRLALDEYGYSYLAWIKDAEEYCLSKYFTEEDYNLLPDGEKNYWISPRAFRTLLEASPSKIGDEIRTCTSELANRLATDRAFARQLQDQIDQESGINRVDPKVSKSLKAKYNETGQDALEFSIQSDTRLHMDIISGNNFKPGQKIKDVLFSFKMEAENGISFHIIEAMLTLTGDDILSFRTIWCCHRESPKYAAILMNRLIRVNLFEDNKKLVDSYDYILGPSDLDTLAVELERVVNMLPEKNPEVIDTDQLGYRILDRYNSNGQAYALAIKELIPTMMQYEKSGADKLETAFIEAVNQYWDHYVLQADPTKNIIDDLEQMVQNRMPRVALALITSDMINNINLCNKYFKRTYSTKQRQALFKDAAPRLIYTLSAAEFDPSVSPDQHIDDMCAFVTQQFDLIKEILIEMKQWPK